MSFHSTNGMFSDMRSAEATPATLTSSQKTLEIGFPRQWPQSSAHQIFAFASFAGNSNSTSFHGSSRYSHI